MATTSPLDITFGVLGDSESESAIDVLAPILDSPRRSLRDGAVRAILAHRSVRGHKELIRRLHKFDDTTHAIIYDRRGLMSTALRDAILGGDELLCHNACRAIELFHEFDLIPTLITALEDTANPFATRTGVTLLALCDALDEELVHPLDKRGLRDPQTIRRHALQSFSASLRRFPMHKRKQVVEAYLTLADRDDPLLRQVLLDPRDPLFLAVVDVLTHGGRPSTMRLALSFLDDPHPPTSALNVIAHRGDREFVRLVLQRIGFEPAPLVAQNLRRMEIVSWLRDPSAALAGLDGTEQHTVVQFLMASGVKRTSAFQVIEHLVLHGQPAGRRAAVAALAEYNGVEANALAMRILDDPDPHTQAAVLGQIRRRGIPGALPRLMELVDSPYEVVRQAARDALAEFNFPHYLASFDLLEDEARRSTGVLVKKVDPLTLNLLADELRSASRTRRLRGLAIAEAMEVEPNVEALAIDLLASDDHTTRAAAARALGACRSAASREALRAALSDQSGVVVEAVRNSLLNVVAAVANPAANSPAQGA